MFGKTKTKKNYFPEDDARFLGLDDRISFLFNIWRHRVGGTSSNATCAKSAVLFEKLEAATRAGVFASRWYAREGESNVWPKADAKTHTHTELTRRHNGYLDYIALVCTTINPYAYCHSSTPL